MAVPLRFKKGFDELGAERFYECRDVDGVDGLEEFVEEWIDSLWDTLKATIAEVLTCLPLLQKRCTSCMTP